MSGPTISCFQPPGGAFVCVQRPGTAAGGGGAAAAAGGSFAAPAAPPAARARPQLSYSWEAGNGTLGFPMEGEFLPDEPLRWSNLRPPPQQLQAERPEARVLRPRAAAQPTVPSVASLIYQG